MRIGILTLPLQTNYGGILQAYALQTVLERMGNSVSLLDAPNWKPYKLPLYKRPLAHSKRFLLRYVFRSSDTPILFEQEMAKKQEVFQKNTRTFIAKYLHAVPETNYYDLQEKDFDAIVVGSDKVWRPKYFPHRDGMSIQDAYLAFAENWKIRRVAYAASFGTDQWEYTKQETKRCGELLKLFNGVSCREDDGVYLAKRYFDVDAIQVLDPTMLLNVSDYYTLINNAEEDGVLKRKEGKKYVLNYLLDENKEANKVLTEIAMSNGMEIKRSKSKSFTVSSFNKDDLSDYVQPPVESWLRDFRDCECVVTDSFHACVFSILNEKPFVVFGNRGRGLSRIYSLLKLFGLESRMVTGDKNYEKALLTPIDYTTISTKVSALREESLAWLKSSIEINSKK